MTGVLLIGLCVIVGLVLLGAAGGSDLRRIDRDLEAERRMREAMAPRYRRIGEDDES